MFQELNQGRAAREAEGIPHRNGKQLRVIG